MKFQLAEGKVLKEIKIWYEKIKNTSIFIDVSFLIIHCVNLESSGFFL